VDLLAPTPRGPRPVAGLPAVDTRAIAKAWLVELVHDTSLDGAAGLPMAELAREGPGLVGALVEALSDDVALGRLAPGGNLAWLAGRAGRLAGAGDVMAAIAAIESLRRAALTGILEAARLDPTTIALLTDRLAHVCSFVAAAAATEMAAGATPAHAGGATPGMAAGATTAPAALAPVEQARDADPPPSRFTPAADPRDGRPARADEDRTERDRDGDRRRSAGEDLPSPLYAAPDEAAPSALRPAPEEPASGLLSDALANLDAAAEARARAGVRRPEPPGAEIHELRRVRDPLEALQAPAPDGGSWQAQLERRLERHAHDGSPFALLAVEVDGLDRLLALQEESEISDSLVRLERALAGELRPADQLIREEQGRYWVTAPDTGPAVAKLLAERLADAAAGAARHHNAPLTVSIGVATCPEDGEEADALTSRADQAMFAARASGTPVA